MDKTKKVTRFIVVYKYHYSAYSFMLGNDEQIETFSTMVSLQKWVSEQKNIQFIEIYEVSGKVELEQKYQVKV